MSPNSYDENGAEELQAFGKGGVHCYRCGGQGHIAARCGTLEPPTVKGKTGFKRDGKGKGGGKGNGKVDWNGFCSYCGKRSHGPRDCWTKQRDDAGGAGGGIDEGIGEINGFDIAALDKDDESEWQEVVRRRFPKSVPTPEQDSNMVDGNGLSKGKRGAHHDRFQGGRVGNPARHVAGCANQVITRVGCRDVPHWREDAEPRRETRQFPNGRRPSPWRQFPRSLKRQLGGVWLGVIGASSRTC